jgi:hypothetical protein
VYNKKDGLSMVVKKTCIKKFGVLSVAKFAAIFGLLWGLLWGIGVGLLAATQVQQLGLGWVTAGASGVLAVVIMIIFGAIFGFIMGAVYAFLFNAAAGVMKGVEMELDIE